ncbi:MAG: Nitroreductase family protein [Betaproteobacteria bacterium ADurb.Bin341]|nr:MAG: Nitroreductase family protein [Betaproteobacteria bacterium ADurb.Bin341]
MSNFGRRICALLIFIRECGGDALRYWRHARIVPNASEAASPVHLAAHVARLSHVIEKGLSMPDFRPRFGGALLMELQQQLLRLETMGADQARREHNYGCSVIRAYRAKHLALGCAVDDLLIPEFRVPGEPELVDPHVKPLRPASAEDSAAFRRVFLSRYSVRDFQKDREPAREVIARAIGIAIQSPSVCNRQTWRVHSYYGNHAREVLAEQNGCRGFSQNVPTVLVVTSDLRFFDGINERYQAWIDGGMFSMSILLALHAEGLGAVALSWGVYGRQDKRLRAVAELPESERIIMLIACGHPSNDCVVPLSGRKPVSEILCEHHHAC